MGDNTINAANIADSTLIAGNNNKIIGKDTITIHAEGDVAFGKDQAIVSINKTIRKSAASDDLKAMLEKLTQAVGNMIKAMPEDAADETEDNLEKLIREALREKPKRKWYAVSCEGLIETAQTVGSLGQSVIEAAQKVLKLLDIRSSV